MRTVQEIMNDVQAFQAMRDFHIEYDLEKETALLVELAELVLVNIQDEEVIRAAEHIIKEYRKSDM